MRNRVLLIAVLALTSPLTQAAAPKVMHYGPGGLWVTIGTILSNPIAALGWK